MSSEKFQELRAALKAGKVLLPGDEGFEASLERWSATCVKPAAAVAQPQTAQEASAVVKFATANGIAFNVRGGGHSTSQSSAAPSPEGMVLDLALMRDVTVDPQARTVTFGGGCTWKDVDTALWEHGLATVGGTVSHTGVGGLILHGGFGFLSGTQGYAIDNLLSCEVVLANGDVVTASEKENEDLFWALRGAGSSFGVVTQFTSKAHPQGDIWSFLMIHTPDKLPTLVEHLNEWHERTDGKQLMAIGAVYAPVPPGQEPPPGGRPPCLVAQYVHIGDNPQADGEKFFEKALAVEALMTQGGIMPYPKLNQANDEMQAPGGRYLFGGSNFTLPMKAENAQAICEKWWDLIHPSTGREDSLFMFEGIPYTAARKVPANKMAFNNRGDYYNTGTVMKWANASEDQAVRQDNREFQKFVRSLNYDDKDLKDGVGQYLNYASDQIEAEKAFGSHADRLRKLKEKYDSNNVFDKLWKLSNATEDRYVAVA